MKKSFEKVIVWCKEMRCIFFFSIKTIYYYEPVAKKINC